MSLTRPSTIIGMHFAEANVSENFAAELRDRFSEIAPVYLESVRPSDDELPENVMHCSVRLYAPYWDARSEEANKVWNETMVEYLVSLSSRYQEALDGLNAELAERNETPVVFDWIEIAFGDQVVIALRALPGGQAPSEVLAVASHVRRLMAEGMLGTNISLVRVPSREACCEIAVSHAEGEEARALKAKWGVEYAEGNVRTFDAKNECFID